MIENPRYGPRRSMEAAMAELLAKHERAPQQRLARMIEMLREEIELKNRRRAKWPGIDHRALGDRRGLGERRKERRTNLSVWSGVECRSGQDRRQSERRASG